MAQGYKQQALYTVDSDQPTHYAKSIDMTDELDCDLGPACGVVEFENWTCEKRNVTCPDCKVWLDDATQSVENHCNELAEQAERHTEEVIDLKAQIDRLEDRLMRETRP